MKNKSTNKIMTNLLVISLVVFLVGEIFKIQHYPHGSLISLIGFGSYLVMSIIEIERLKKIIARSEKDDIKV